MTRPVLLKLPEKVELVFGDGYKTISEPAYIFNERLLEKHFSGL